MKVTVTAALIVLLVACDAKPPSRAARQIAFRAQAPSEIAENQPNDDFQDVSLHIEAAQIQGDSTMVDVRGLHHGTPVGLRIQLAAHADHSVAVDFRSTGAKSDALVASLSNLYNSPGPRKMKPSAAFDAIPLAGDLSAIDKQEVKLKLFCHTQREDQYCELYLNTNLPAGTVEIAEKDPGYRSPLLAWLGES